MRSYVLSQNFKPTSEVNKELARLKNVNSRLHKKFRTSGSQAAFSRYLTPSVIKTI